MTEKELMRECLLLARELCEIWKDAYDARQEMKRQIIEWEGETSALLEFLKETVERYRKNPPI